MNERTNNDDDDDVHDDKLYSDFTSELMDEVAGKKRLRKQTEVGRSRHILFVVAVVVV